MTWPPQLPDLHNHPYLNPIEMVWDEFGCRAKKKQPTSPQHVGTPSRLGKAFQVKQVGRMPRVCKAVIKEKGGYFEESQI
jgi:hypothetical protein